MNFCSFDVFVVYKITVAVQSGVWGNSRIPNYGRPDSFPVNATVGPVAAKMPHMIGPRNQLASSLNEGQARYILIDPALTSADWNLDDRMQVGFEIPVDGYDADLRRHPRRPQGERRTPV